MEPGFAVEQTSTTGNRAGSEVYQVERGDTLGSIAQRYGTSVQALMQVNGIRDPNYIYAGQRLSIPG
jgi:putative chitinase